jgi:hypothetical protein
MSQQDHFAGGFFLGAVVGGVLGGILGALAANRIHNRQTEDEDTDFSKLSDDIKRNLAEATPEERMELARQGLEDKIAQLNAAIEDVRQQLGDVNGHGERITSYDQPGRLDA